MHKAWHMFTSEGARACGGMAGQVTWRRGLAEPGLRYGHVSK